MIATVDSLLLDIAILRVRMSAGLRMTDADFIESEHPRDDIGRFDIANGTSSDHARVAQAHEIDSAKHKEKSLQEGIGSAASMSHQLAAIGHTVAARAHKDIAQNGGDKAYAMSKTAKAINESREANGSSPRNQEPPKQPVQAEPPEPMVYDDPPKPAVQVKSGGGNAKPSSGKLVGYSDIEPSLRRNVYSLVGIEVEDVAHKLGSNLPSGVVASTSFAARMDRVRMVTDFHDASGNYLGSAQRTHHVGSKTVEHDLFRLEPEAQGTGLGTAYLKNSVEVYKAAGLSKITTEAALQNGGYTWARLGFVPDEVSWGYVKDNIEEQLPDLSPGDRAQIEPLLGSRDPHTIWKIADHPQGKMLLSGSAWKGSFDLYDPESNERLNASIAKRTS